MKRLLPTIPFIFFLLLNACGGSATTGASSVDIETAVAGTLTVIGWTPISTPFYNPVNITYLFDTLNANLPNAHTLEWAFDAEYTVTDVDILNMQNVPGMVLSLKVRCICKKENCCFPERTFVVVIDSMKKNVNNIESQIPSAVTRIVVVCYDYKTPNGAVSVAWNDVKDYLLEKISGRQLSERVTRTAVP